jgi:hypothetical protein
MTDKPQRFEAVEPASREELLIMCEEMMRECHDKVAGSKRVRDPEYARARQGYINAFSSLMNAYRHMLKDEELEEMSERIEELKEQERSWETYS